MADARFRRPNIHARIVKGRSAVQFRRENSGLHDFPRLQIWESPGIEQEKRSQGHSRRSMG
jgi:hypothetical protein